MKAAAATVWLAVCVVAACSAPSGNRGSTPGSATAAGPAWFEEVAAARGLAFVHRSGHETRYRLPEIMGGGVALFDMDGDGDLDIFMVQSGQLSAAPGTPAGHRLFRNRGDGSFEDVSAEHGIATVAVTAWASPRATTTTTATWTSTSRISAPTSCCRTTDTAVSWTSRAPRVLPVRAGAPAQRSWMSTPTATSISS